MTVNPSYQLTKEVDASIFRAYDIRGIVGEQLTPNVIYTIARAISTEALDCQQNTVIIGRDGRNSGPELSKALAAGLMEGGCNVIDLGMVPTPVLYYATHTLGSKTGVMLTGSHNPSDYNGLKMVIAGQTLAESQIKSLYQRICTENLSADSGTFSRQSLLTHYIERITQDVQLAKPLKVVVDCGNGVAGTVAGDLLRALGCEVTELYCDVDGDFPNHHPDPSELSNLSDLIAAVREQSADLGLAFDGDGDRLGVVSPSGEVIFPDRQMILFAEDVLSRHEKAPIIFDVKCSYNLAKAIAQFGGQPVMARTGHSLIKAAMRHHKAQLAGEMSGHIFFQDRWFGFDDALYASARLLEILAKEESIEAAFARLPNSYHTPEIRIQIDEEKKFAFVESFKRKAQFPHARLITIDGVRVEYPDGWGLLRASNTTPCLILRFEARNKAGLERIQHAFREQIALIDNSLAF